MTTVVEPQAADQEGQIPPDSGREPSSARPPLFTAAAVRRQALAIVRWFVVGAATLAIFSAFLASRGASPAAALEAMWNTSLGDSEALGDTLIRATPFLLAALATVVPARAGLFNIGAEGQLLLGAVGATGAARLVADDWPTGVALVALAVGGALCGAVWAVIPGLLRTVAGTSEAITTLLFNHLALVLVTWLCFGPWKDPASLGQAYTADLTGNEELPILWGSRVHAGWVLAVVAAVACWLVLRSTAWGFKLTVMGGNREAARRAGLAVGGLSLAAMAIGGALGGLGGMIEIAGTEGRLRPDVLVGFGYIGFLAAWLARHHPLKVVASAGLMGAIAVGGSGLRIASGLSGAAVNILMALVLFAVLGTGDGTRRANREES